MCGAPPPPCGIAGAAARGAAGAGVCARAFIGGPPPPRADQVPTEQNLVDQNDPINQENAALDRMINGICRGC